MDRTIISQELAVIIDALKPLEDIDVIVTLPNTSLKQRRLKDKIIISIIGINGQVMRGLNKDEGKMGVRYDLTLGIKSISERPLDKLIDVQNKAVNIMKSLRYYEGDSSIIYDAVGSPVIYQYLIGKIYKGE